MPHSLVRTNLSTRLADMMEREINNGGWGDSLPGHRTLMDRYAVSANTCLAAIARLEARGIIAAGEQGRRRRVLTRPARTAAALRDLLIIDRAGIPSGEDSLLLHAYREAWEKRGGTVQNITVDYPRCSRPETLLREAVTNHKAEALLLHVPPRVWVEAAAKLRPVFLSGGEWRGPPVTGAGYHIQNEIAALAARLRKLGHQRIAVPLDHAGETMASAIRAGLAAGLNLSPDDSRLAPLVCNCPERTAAAWQRLWQKLFATEKPTAVILTDDIHYLSLLGHCQRSRLRIPADVSVICLESTGHLEWCHPLPVRMRFPIPAAVRVFRAWMRRGCQPGGMTFLPLECCDGETLGPPAR